jgi:hypothetical protein
MTMGLIELLILVVNELISPDIDWSLFLCHLYIRQICRGDTRRTDERENKKRAQNEPQEGWSVIPSFSRTNRRKPRRPMRLGEIPIEIEMIPAVTGRTS